MANRLVVAVVSLGSLIGTAMGAAPAAAHEDTPPPRLVSVSGESTIAVTPDRARLVMHVDQLAAEIKTGEAEVNKIVRAYLAEAKALGAKDEEISTTGVSIQPEYVWDEKARRQQLVGYRVRREIAVAVNVLARLGDFILRATAAGVNQVNPPLLEYSDEKRVQREALAKAAQDARAKAQLLAETLGARLGPVHRISADDIHAPPPIPLARKAMMAEAADAGAEMGFALGEIRFRAQVSAEFDLLPR